MPHGSNEVVFVSIISFSIKPTHHITSSVEYYGVCIIFYTDRQLENIHQFARLVDDTLVQIYVLEASATLSFINFEWGYFQDSKN